MQIECTHPHRPESKRCHSCAKRQYWLEHPRDPNPPLESLNPPRCGHGAENAYRPHGKNCLVCRICENARKVERDHAKAWANRPPDLPDEEWRPVAPVAYRHLYEISSEGRVRRIGKHGTQGRVLKAKLTRFGYYAVELCNGGGTRAHRRRGRWHFVHQLVLRAFIGPPPSAKHLCNHKDGVKLHNRPENLEWATPSENHQHAIRTGLKRADWSRREHQATPAVIGAAAAAGGRG